MLESGITWSHAQLVLDNEFAQMVKRVVQGIPVDDETLAVDVIREVGAFGDYVSHEHTRRHMRALQSAPNLMDRRPRESWEARGGLAAIDRAAEEARHILATHKAEPLPSGAAETIREIVQAGEAALAPPPRQPRARRAASA